MQEYRQEIIRSVFMNVNKYVPSAKLHLSDASPNIEIYDVGDDMIFISILDDNLEIAYYHTGYTTRDVIGKSSVLIPLSDPEYLLKVFDTLTNMRGDTSGESSTHRE